MTIWRSDRGGQGRRRRNKERSGDERVYVAVEEWKGEGIGIEEKRLQL